MIKKIIILFFSIFFFGLSKDSDVIPFNKELTELGRTVYGNNLGGVNVLMNSKSNEREEFELYFKFHDTPGLIMDKNIKENRTRKELEQLFDRNYLNKYYSSNYLELKNGEKFLYGRFFRMQSAYYKLELYFIDKNDELKIRFYTKREKDDKGDKYLKKIDENRNESYFNVPFPVEEITLITQNRKIQKRNGFYTSTEEELYEWLLNLFKEKIPEEFFERRKYKDNYYESDIYYLPEYRHLIPSDVILPYEDHLDYIPPEKNNIE